jgi:hypothetical protein
MSDSGLQTEFDFTLPQGYVDEDGTVHKEGRMRLATAADEIQPLNNPLVQENSSYMTVVLLSRVVTQLGTIDEVTPEVIESLFVTDLAYLQDLYERINDGGTDFAGVTGGGGRRAGDGRRGQVDPQPTGDGRSRTGAGTEPRTGTETETQTETETDAEQEFDLGNTPER